MASLARSWPFLSLLSWGIVAFGQPAWVPALGLVAAICGYALFWQGMIQLKKKWARFTLASSWFVATQLLQLSWMTSDVYQGIYTWFFWAFLSIGCGLQFGLLSLLVQKRMEWLRILAIASLWAILEWLRLYFTAGHTWNPAGLALTTYFVPAQFASIGGVYFLSFWVILVNAVVLRGLRSWGWGAALAAVPYLFGLFQLTLHHPQMVRGDTLSAVLVQTGLEPGDKGSCGIIPGRTIHPIHQWGRIINLLSVHEGKKIDLILLPEGTVPYRASLPIWDYNATASLLFKPMGWETPTPEEPLASYMESPDCGPYLGISHNYFCRAIADHYNASLIGGFDDYDVEQDATYNAALHFTPGSSVPHRYGKQVLLPIVESMPWKWMEPIAARYGIGNWFKKGEGAEIFQAGVPMGATICYEETFGQIVRENRRLGAELLLNLTVDGWYPQSKLPMQHFTHGRLRAIENGVPMLRACHTGVTAAVDSLGRTVAMVGTGDRPSERIAEALYVEVPTHHYRTLYSLVGNGFVLGISFLFTGLFVWRKYNPPKRDKSKKVNKK